MGAPAGHPYAHPEGVCINGLGALPSPYGPTLRGAHNGPSGLQKISRYAGGGVMEQYVLQVQFRPKCVVTRCTCAAKFLDLAKLKKWNRHNIFQIAKIPPNLRSKYTDTPPKYIAKR